MIMASSRASELKSFEELIQKIRMLENTAWDLLKQGNIEEAVTVALHCFPELHDSVSKISITEVPANKEKTNLLGLWYNVTYILVRFSNDIREQVKYLEFFLENMKKFSTLEIPEHFISPICETAIGAMEQYAKQIRDHIEVAQVLFGSEEEYSNLEYLGRSAIIIRNFNSILLIPSVAETLGLERYDGVINECLTLIDRTIEVFQTRSNPRSIEIGHSS